MEQKNDPFIMVMTSIIILIINFPVVDFIVRLKKSECHCAKIWKLNYLIIYLLFWYASSALEIMIYFLMPSIVDWFKKSIFY